MHCPGTESDLPPVRLIVADHESNEDVVIKISDEVRHRAPPAAPRAGSHGSALPLQGGGIPRSGIPRIWSYFYTTAAPEFGALAASDFSVDAPLAGLGYGLPLSRLYARYFGGDLQVISMEGYGAWRAPGMHAKPVALTLFARRHGRVYLPQARRRRGRALGRHHHPRDLIPFTVASSPHTNACGCRPVAQPVRQHLLALFRCPPPPCLICHSTLAPPRLLAVPQCLALKCMARDNAHLHNRMTGPLCISPYPHSSSHFAATAWPPAPLAPAWRARHRGPRHRRARARATGTCGRQASRRRTGCRPPPCQSQGRT